MVTLSGLLVLMPTLVPPSKISSDAIFPSLSEALAVIGIFAGAIKTALLVGLVMAALGALFVVVIINSTRLEAASRELIPIKRVLLVCECNAKEITLWPAAFSPCTKLERSFVNHVGEMLLTLT